MNFLSLGEMPLYANDCLSLSLHLTEMQCRDNCILDTTVFTLYFKWEIFASKHARRPIHSATTLANIVFLSYFDLISIK